MSLVYRDFPELCMNFVGWLGSMTCMALPTWCQCAKFWGPVTVPACPICMSQMANSLGASKFWASAARRQK